MWCMCNKRKDIVQVIAIFLKITTDFWQLSKRGLSFWQRQKSHSERNKSLLLIDLLHYTKLYWISFFIKIKLNNNESAYIKQFNTFSSYTHVHTFFSFQFNSKIFLCLSSIPTKYRIISPWFPTLKSYFYNKS